VFHPVFGPSSVRQVKPRLWVGCGSWKSSFLWAILRNRRCQRPLDTMPLTTWLSIFSTSQSRKGSHHCCPFFDHEHALSTKTLHARKALRQQLFFHDWFPPFKDRPSRLNLPRSFRLERNAINESNFLPTLKSLPWPRHYCLVSWPRISVTEPVDTAPRRPCGIAVGCQQQHTRTHPTQCYEGTFSRSHPRGARHTGNRWKRPGSCIEPGHSRGCSVACWWQCVVCTCRGTSWVQSRSVTLRSLSPRPSRASEINDVCCWRACIGSHFGIVLPWNCIEEWALFREQSKKKKTQRCAQLPGRSG